jgi:hypothetical protein
VIGELDSVAASAVVIGESDDFADACRQKGTAKRAKRDGKKGQTLFINLILILLKNGSKWIS